MRVYLCTDMEGATGVTVPEEFMPDGQRFAFGRKMLTHDVAAAVEGLRAGGATRVVVLDGHGGGGNLVMEDLPGGAEYVSGRGSPQPLPFLDDSFDAVGFVGQHSKAGTERAIWPHTQSSETWLGLWANGLEIGEIGQFSIAAGHHDLPVVFLSGDLAATEEVRELCGEVETVAVKEGCSPTRGLCLAPADARQAIYDGAKRSLSLIGTAKPYKVDLPMEVKIAFKNTASADSAEAGGAERVDHLTTRRVVDSGLGIYRV